MRFFIIAVFIFTVSCASLQIDTNNTFTITNDAGDTFSCTIGLKSDEGVYLDSECIGFYEKDGSTYKCSIAVGTDNKPVTDFVKIDENCEIVVKK